MSPVPVEYWFEFASTYSYPATMRVAQLAEAAGTPLRWCPFLLGPIFKLQGWADSPFNQLPIKGRYMWRDLERICEGLGIPFRRPSVFPRNGLLAARVACRFADAVWMPSFARAVYTANFAEDREIAERGVISELLSDAGQDAAAILQQAQAPEAKDGLRRQTEQAAQHGVFGAPNLRVGDELFWGNDRLEAGFAWLASGRDKADAAI
jgi:2-hydroxychromene-2-carboxylate isomerase